jgi:26S proteasome non-ATPase regulatory subunit 10
MKQYKYSSPLLIISFSFITLITLHPHITHCMNNHHTLVIKKHTKKAPLRTDIERAQAAAMNVYNNNIKAITCDRYWRKTLTTITPYTEGLPAICFASLLGHTDMVEYFIRHYPEHVACTSQQGTNALYYAAVTGRAHVTELLLPIVGHTINQKGKNGNAVLHCAASSGNMEVLYLLLSKNPDTNIINDKSETPLFAAVKKQHFAVIKLLLDCAANINHKDIEEKNVLHILAKQEESEVSLTIAQYLIEHGICINEQDKNYHTPLFIAVMNKRARMAKLLFRYEATINTKSRTKKIAARYL